MADRIYNAVERMGGGGGGGVVLIHHRLGIERDLVVTICHCSTRSYTFTQATMAVSKFNFSVISAFAYCLTICR